MVSNEPIFAEKQKELDKREKEELKKLEKQFKKEAQDIDDIYNDAGLKGEAKFKQMKDRILKTIKENAK